MNNSLIDTVITNFDLSLRAITGKLAPTERPNPAEKVEDADLTEAEKKHAAGLMRINHTGEVCAQALYLGQSLVAKSKEIKDELQRCSDEEVDHLFWCQERVNAMNSHVSYLNPLWFGGSLCLGIVAGLAGDKWNLGFLEETEKQVGAHLESHLEKLPSADKKSRDVVEQMRIDEANHAQTAHDHGAADLPFPIKKLMKVMSKVMTNTTYYI